MNTYDLDDFTFCYPQQEDAALKNLSFQVAQGEFIVICGPSGCGKSTLLRQLKPILTPYGRVSGSIQFEGRPLASLSQLEESSLIGFVQQSPDNQIVTDKVWHELAFGLESLGLDTPTIRLRVAEMASFFGIQTWFHKSVTELSGGQKQLLNLAAIMVMQPTVLILDEPTSQLDPIAATDFLETIEKINRELGVSIILTEHRLEDALPMSDRVLVMEQGEIIASGSPDQIGAQLKALKHPMFKAMPTPMQVYAGLENDLPCPITIRDGRQFLQGLGQPLEAAICPGETTQAAGSPLIEVHDVWFRYEKKLPDVVKGLSAQIYQGEIYAILGGNGSGKTTSLSLMTGLLMPYRGQVKVMGQALGELSNQARYRGLLGVLPQNPQALFVKKTLELDLYEMLTGSGLDRASQARKVQEVVSLCQIEDLLGQHPYDLSGGEQQRGALAKVLLLEPKILFLDEVTKGLDGIFKEHLGALFQGLQKKGITIVMVSHDLEFCARYATRCAMFFDGAIVSEDEPRRFFCGKTFYTTAANRMARSLLPQAVLAEDIIKAWGGEVPEAVYPRVFNEALYQEQPLVGSSKPLLIPPKITSLKVLMTPKRAIGAILTLLIFGAIALFLGNRWGDWRQYLVNGALIFSAAVFLNLIFPSKSLALPQYGVQQPADKRRLDKRTLVGVAIVLLIIPLTLFVGNAYFGERKYYFISMLIIMETLLPFMMIFESRKPQARELVIIAVLCALAVAGRAAFFMIPQFKPMMALVIIAGVCLGGESGFLVGAISAFVSNMLMGQGPWSPWQMFAFGLIGFLAGVLFRKGWLRKKRNSLCIFGLLSTFFIYGGIMNPASVLMVQSQITVEMLVIAYLNGIPFDLIHAGATGFFLWFLAAPLIDKLERIKVKYGLIR